jgi:predicted transcriptional regulator
MKKRKSIGYTSRTSCFSSKLICGECGGFYGSKVWHSTSKYRRTIWQCNRKFKNDKKVPDASPLRMYARADIYEKAGLLNILPSRFL